MKHFLGLILFVVLGCQPLEPSGRQSPPSSAALNLTLDADSLQLLEPATQLKIQFSQDERVYKSQIVPFTFDPMQFEELAVGPQSLRLLVYAEDSVVAQADADIELIPGEQTLQPEFRYLFQNAFAFQVLLEKAVLEEPPVTFVDVKPIVEDERFQCLLCHTGTGKFHVGLDVYPYTSDKYANDQVKIVESIVDRATRVVGDPQRMPTGPRPSLEREEIDLIEAWLADGLIVEPTRCLEPGEMVRKVVFSLDYDGVQQTFELKNQDGGLFTWDGRFMAETIEQTAQFLLYADDEKLLVSVEMFVTLKADETPDFTIALPCEA